MSLIISFLMIAASSILLAFYLTYLVIVIPLAMIAFIPLATMIMLLLN